MRDTSLVAILSPLPQPSGEEAGPVSLLLPLPKPEAGGGEREGGGVVEWRPPHIDWNPWTNRSAYLEGSPYSQMEPVSTLVHSTQSLNQTISL